MREPFKSLGEQLLRGGVAPRYVRRYLTELADHAADIAAEQERAGVNREDAETSALAHLGRNDDLAQAMIKRAQFRSWSARAPGAMFLLAPSVVLAGFFVVAVVLLVWTVQFFRPEPTAQPILPVWFAALTNLIIQFNTYVLPLLLGWGVALVAIRQRIPHLWPTIGLVTIAFVSSTSRLDIALPSIPGGHGEISIGSTILPPFRNFTSSVFHGLLNLSLTLAPYFILHARQMRRWDIKILGGILAIVLIAAPAQATEDTATKSETLLAAAKQASGGAAWDRLQGWHETGIVNVGGVEGSYDSWSDMRTLKTCSHGTFGGKPQWAGFNGLVAWDYSNPQHPELKKSSQALRAARRDSFLSSFGFFLTQRFPADLAYIGSREADRLTYDVVKITPRDAESAELWFERQTHLLTRMTLANGEFATLAGFQVFDGVLQPTDLRQGDENPNHEMTWHILNVQTGPLTAGICEPPSVR